MAVPERRPSFDADGRMLRDPADVIALPSVGNVALAERLRHRVTGDWWNVLGRLGVRLLVSREYEHLLVCLGLDDRGRPEVTYLPVPHPSGIAVERVSGDVWVALTRNPNQVLNLRTRHSRLLPASSWFFPGSLYLHDLAFVGGKLYGSAAGRNLVAEIGPDAMWRPRWWPRIVDVNGSPDQRRNWLQLNSIAAGMTLRDSFFTASADRRLRYTPGDQRFDPDGRGVIFSGRTREVLVGGLTRPHSARLRGGVLWVDNSGYGTVGVVAGGRLEVAQRLPGWTRGLCFVDDVAFVGTSQVLPRFAHYAPGVRRAVCGVHALDAGNGAILGSIRWSSGNQVFAIDWLPSVLAGGLPYSGRRPGMTTSVERVFYT
jgi:uncharacterized protein (TIGR03032 family)